MLTYVYVSAFVVTTKPHFRVKRRICNKASVGGDKKYMR